MTETTGLSPLISCAEAFKGLETGDGAHFFSTSPMTSTAPSWAPIVSPAGARTPFTPLRGDQALVTVGWAMSRSAPGELVAEATPLAAGAWNVLAGMRRAESQPPARSHRPDAEALTEFRTVPPARVHRLVLGAAHLNELTPGSRVADDTNRRSAHLCFDVMLGPMTARAVMDAMVPRRPRVPARRSSSPDHAQPRTNDSYQSRSPERKNHDTRCSSLSC
jgi:hypothetical protein